FGTLPAPLLIAPLGATTFLIFVVPNSPLAQPWSAIMGNFLSALVALAVPRYVSDPALAAAGSVGLAVAAMGFARAMHPPGGAVALLIALMAAENGPAPFFFAVSPVLVNTTLLVALAVVYNRVTGRNYPFRQPAETSNHGTKDPAPERRLGLSAEELGDILQGMRLDANIGAEDLARLIGMAEAEAASRHLGGLVAADIMSRDLVTVRPDAHPDALAEVFRTHGFKTLPVVDGAGLYQGLLSQSALLGLHDQQIEARQIMAANAETIGPAEPLARLLVLMADGGAQALAVVKGDRLHGIVTRSDLMAAMAHVLNR
ncbi:MAG: HPP family protein, partial [Paracoccaceae bacterium]